MSNKDEEKIVDARVSNLKKFFDLLLKKIPISDGSYVFIFTNSTEMESNIEIIGGGRPPNDANGVFGIMMACCNMLLEDKEVKADLKKSIETLLLECKNKGIGHHHKISEETLH